MKHLWSGLVRWVMIWGCMAALCTSAQAGSYTCALGTVSGMTLSYDPTVLAPTVGTATITISCSKTGKDAATVYWELGVNAGLNASGTQTRLQYAGYYLNDNLLQGSDQLWSDVSSNRIKGNVVNSALATSDFSVSYKVSLPVGQNVPAGTYTDTLTVRLYQGGTASQASLDPSPTTRTLQISATQQARCVLSSPPGDVLFFYTSFQQTPAVAATNFAVTCTNGTTYALSLDAYAGELLGLAYALSLGSAGNLTGTGLPQSATIHGSMPANQAGICTASSCFTTQQRTLTITY